MGWRALKTMGWAAMVALAVACSGGPSDADIERLVREATTEGAHETFVAVKDFRVTDRREESSGRTVCEVSYTLEFTQSIEEVRASLGKGLKPNQGFEDMGAAIEVVEDGMSVLALQMAYGDFAAGDTKPMTRRVTLEEWESGWRIVDAQ